MTHLCPLILELWSHLSSGTLELLLTGDENRQEG